MRRADDPHRYRAWLEDAVTQEVFEGAREAIVRQMERPVAPGDQSLEEDLELVRRLRTIRWFTQIVRASQSGVDLQAQLEKADPTDGAEQGDAQ